MGATDKKLSDAEIMQSKSDRIMNTVAWRTAYYRANPQRFVKDFFNIDLHLFQKILIYAMMVYDYFYFVAARGIGKTFLVSLYACVRCILYPGTQIVAVSATFKQGKEIVLKITDIFMKKSSLLCGEIERTSIGQNDCGVWFKNGSWIQITVANDNARGKRANIVIIDEARMVKQNIVESVIRPMANVPRQPGYLKYEKYKHIQESNKEMYMSSAWYTASEMYEKVKAYTANSLNDKLKYFICDLPYQLSIMEGLLTRDKIENEMSEATFSDITFMMEYEGKFYGSSADALYSFDTCNSRRVLQDCFYNLDYYKDFSIKIPKKEPNEKRILSLDVALLASKKHNNDAACFMLNNLFQTGEDTYISNYSYIDTYEGILTDDLGLIAMRYFYNYDCDYIAIDANGVGQGILDYIMKDRFDPVFNIPYKAMTCINNDDLAERCKVKDARKCIYAIKATPQMNSNMHLSLRTALQNGNINFLVDETNLDELLSNKIKNYEKLSSTMQAKVKLPYYQTSALINELINLDHEMSGNMVKVKEKPGMRKDRFSSLEYNNYVVDQIKQSNKKKKIPKEDIKKMISIRAPKSSKRFG